MSIVNRTDFFTPAAFIQTALDNDVLKFGEFTLKSGRISPYFFNAGLLATGQALNLLAQGYADTLADLTKNSQQTHQELVIFGAAYKGIPFVAATAQALWQYHGINAQWGYNRKEAKTHGEGGNLVGADLTGKSVWILDDVITAGTAMREVMALLNTVGAKLAGIIVALDRKEKGQSNTSAMNELQQELNVPVQALVSIDDLIDYLREQDDTKSNHLQKMVAYRQQYGVA